MSFILIGLAFILAVIDWLAVAFRWKKIEYFAKPGVIVALIAWLTVNGGYQGQLLFFIIGLGFSLAGDISLMLPKGSFLAGLVFFLIAHVFYILGFNFTIPQFSFAGLVILILIGINTVEISRRIIKGCVAQGKDFLRIPVLIYTFVISIMVFSAILTLVRPNIEWVPLASLLVSLGAILFFISDTLLSWNRFVTPFKNADLSVIITYHIAQITIILGAGINFLTR